MHVRGDCSFLSIPIIKTVAIFSVNVDILSVTYGYHGGQVCIREQKVTDTGNIKMNTVLCDLSFQTECSLTLFSH